MDGAVSLLVWYQPHRARQKLLSSPLRLLSGAAQTVCKTRKRHTQRHKRGWRPALQRGQGLGCSDTTPRAVLGQGVPGRGMLQQGSQDALQLYEAGTEGCGGEEVQLVGRVKGQDGDEPPAPRWAVC